MTNNNFPTIFKDLKEGSIYCFLSSLQYLRLSTNNSTKYFNEVHSAERLSFNPLSSFNYEPEKYKILKIEEFRELITQFSEEMNAKILNAISSPDFLLEKTNWFDVKTYYCYFSETDRISICPINIPAVCETEDGFEEATQINRDVFISVNNEHFIKQYQLHLKKCQTISKDDFISILQSYFTEMLNKLDNRIEMSFPIIKRKLPDDYY
jgi:hypothetical protein